MSKKQENKILPWEKIFPFLEWIGELKDPNVLRLDIIAGITIAFILVPQSMAYAQLAGLPIEVGLFTAFVPVLLAGLFGSSRQMSTGPITIVSLMTGTALAPYVASHPESAVIYASLLAFFIGVFYILLGLLRGGVLVDFLSYPVIIGFTNALALITMASQAGKIFGVSYDKGNHFFEGIFNLVVAISQNTDIPTLIFGIVSIVFLVGISYLRPYLPKVVVLSRVLILLVISIIVSHYIGFAENFGGTIVGTLPSSLPGIGIPFLDPQVRALQFSDMVNLFISAVIIALIGFSQSISVAKFVGTKTKQKVSANRELMGQGIANIGSSLFGGLGVAGSLSKTAVSMRAGAKTGFSSVVTGLMVGLTLLFLTPYLYHLPMVVLAAIIMVAVSDLIKIDPIIKSWKTEHHDGWVAVVTFILTLVLTPNVEAGILFGIIVSLILFIIRTMRPKIVELSLYKDDHYRDAYKYGLKTSKHITAFRFDGSLYFANAGYFEDKIVEYIATKKKLKYVIVDFAWMSDIDSTGMEVLENLHHRLAEEGIKFHIASIRVKVLKKFIRSGFIERFKKRNIFIHVSDAVEYIDDRHGKDLDMEPLLEYDPDKKKKKKHKIGKYLAKKYIGNK